ncbi:MAG: HAMP domain-containing sensor histidine kinase [Armatimonadota bacterium]|nr:HAMP domain-containing sensor histidine kinase [Armatimonadota bacterium]MDR7548833.1 HAMP domain-containing sensor histidine kinase [Armatimonadota bacterium]
MVRFSLRRKFFLAFVGLAVVFAATFGILAVHRLREALTEQVRIRAKVVAEELAREASRFLPTPEGQSETPQSSRLTRRLVAGTVLYAQIVKDGTVRFADGESWLAPPADPLTRPLVVVERATSSGRPYLDIFRAIPEYTLDRQTYVRIGFPLDDVYARIRAESVRIGVASLLLLATGVAAAFVLQRAIVGPVERMVDAIRHLARGDYSARVAAHTRDELRVLAEELNAMAEAIQARDRELARVNEALRKANRIKDEFSAAMSHELKTPLHAIRAYAQLLLEGIDGPLTDAQRQDLEALLATGDHLQHLIEGILRYSALETGETAPQIDVVDAAVVVEQARKNVAHLARAKGLPIEAHVDGPLPVRADETMLRQILINLLHNAIKYTPSGRITIESAARDGQVLFAVTDTGAGIPPGFEQEIFEPFRRAGQAGRREVDGIGLGLAVAKRYVEQQGGRIWFERRVEGGTTFYFTLPAGARVPADRAAGERP